MLIAKNESNLSTSEEFYNFVFELSIANDIPDSKFQVDRNLDLPLELLIEYNKLVCQHHNNSNQCMPGIDVSDVTNISNLTPEEKDDLAYYEGILARSIETQKSFDIVQKAIKEISGIDTTKANFNDV